MGTQRPQHLQGELRGDWLWDRGAPLADLFVSPIPQSNCRLPIPQDDWRLGSVFEGGNPSPQNNIVIRPPNYKSIAPNSFSKWKDQSAARYGQAFSCVYCRATKSVAPV